MTRYLRFTEEPARGVLLDWWRHLEEHDRGGRAELRRCATPAQVVFVPAFHRLLDRLRNAGLNVQATDRLAAVAGLVAGVKSDATSPGGMAVQLAGGANTEPPVVSPLRFRRLLETDQPDDVFTLLRRFVAQLGGACDLVSLAHAAAEWPEQPRLRRDWALAYYENIPDMKKETAR